jgi:hypothetical protein
MLEGGIGYDTQATKECLWLDSLVKPDSRDDKPADQPLGVSSDFFISPLPLRRRAVPGMTDLGAHR